MEAEPHKYPHCAFCVTSFSSELKAQSHFQVPEDLVVCKGDPRWLAFYRRYYKVKFFFFLTRPFYFIFTKKNKKFYFIQKISEAVG